MEQAHKPKLKQIHWGNMCLNRVLEARLLHQTKKAQINRYPTETRIQHSFYLKFDTMQEDEMLMVSDFRGPLRIRKDTGKVLMLPDLS